MDLANIWLFRIVPIQNLECIILNGSYCKNILKKKDAGFITLGSIDVISRRDTAEVKCYPGKVVNDFVPFYFSVRTPMLYNIITGRGVPVFPQEDIIYLCFKLNSLASSNFEWCYTNGNAATAITKFYKKLDGIEEKLDWHSIKTTDFRDENADGDEDRIRKKHSEFLVKGYVSSDYIEYIVVHNDLKKIETEAILAKMQSDIKVYVSPKNEFYFK